jgi:predicted MFS family arabinose efflux permease
MYRREFRLGWGPLAAASVGMGLGAPLGHYTMSLFGPPLLAEFGWSKAQFALMGSLPLLTLALMPFIGRFIDRYGVRAAAAIGFTGLPLCFVAFALMSGNIYQFYAIYLLTAGLGPLTSTLVFTRVVVQKFDRARGIALSLLMTAPPLVGAVAAPLLDQVIKAEGWRAGYFTLAAVSAIGGVIAIAFTPALRAGPARKRELEPGLSRQELLQLLRNPSLILVALGMFLVNIPQVFANSQMKLTVMDSGVSSDAATVMMSVYAVGVIIGRILSGLALDRVRPHLVALATLSLPAVGYVVLASPATLVLALGLGVFVIGFAQGAEGDIGAFLVSRLFDVRNFSLAMGVVGMMHALGSTLGATLLSFTLARTESYDAFLIVSAVGTVVGAALFVLACQRPTAGRPAELAAEG